MLHSCAQALPQSKAASRELAALLGRLESSVPTHEPSVSAHHAPHKLTHMLSLFVTSALRRKRNMMLKWHIAGRLMHAAVQAATRRSMCSTVADGLPLPAAMHLVPGLLQEPDADSLPVPARRGSSPNGPASPLAADAPSSPSFLSCLPSGSRNPSTGDKLMQHAQMAACMHA
jgi:hypothetical protein